MTTVHGRTMIEPPADWGDRPDEHHCEPLPFEPGWLDDPADLRIGHDDARLNARPCIGWERPSSSIELPMLDSLIPILPVEGAAEVVLWLRGLLDTEPLRSPKPGWETHHEIVKWLLNDLASKPRVAAILAEWETETKDRRAARLQQAVKDLGPLEERRERLALAQNMARDRDLPVPAGLVG